MDLRACEPTSVGLINRRIRQTSPNAVRTHPWEERGLQSCLASRTRGRQTTFHSGKRLESGPVRGIFITMGVA